MCLRLLFEKNITIAQQKDHQSGGLSLSADFPGNYFDSSVSSAGAGVSSTVSSLGSSKFI